MKVAEGEVIPGLEDARIIGPDEPTDATVSEICEEELDRLYGRSWLSDVFRRVDATALDDDTGYNGATTSHYFDGGGGAVEFDKYARGSDFTSGWNNEWLEMLIRSIEDSALEQIRERCTVVNNDSMDLENIEEHFGEEYGYHNAEPFRVRPDVYLYVSPDVFGYDVIRDDFTVMHRARLNHPFETNYAIAHTRRGFDINAHGVLYDIRDEMQRNPPE